MSIAPATPPRTARTKTDAVLASAVDIARSAALEDAEHASHVGPHIGMTMVGERLAAHQFECTMRGYVGWVWTVTVARAPRARVATICEVHLLPTDNAILAPSWLPWAERLKPGDIGPGDVLPFKADDPRLVEGYTPTGNEEEDRVAIEELALARARVLSETGRDEAAKRWYEGPHGPRSQGSLQSAASCGSCGFFIPIQGALGQVFGVCANAWSEDDGKVVAFGHGCGAHSETDVPHRASEWPANKPLIDETSIIPVTADELAALPERAQDDSAAHPDRETSKIADENLSSQPESDAAPEDALADGGAVSHVGADNDVESPETHIFEAAVTDNEARDPRQSSSRRGSRRSRGRSSKGNERVDGGTAVSATPAPETSTQNENVVAEIQSESAAAGENTPSGDGQPKESRSAITLELPESQLDKRPKISREEVLHNLDLIAQALPQRKTD